MTTKYWNGTSWVVPKIKVWDGTQWANAGSSGTADASKVLTGFTFSNDTNVDIAGTMIDKSGTNTAAAWDNSNGDTVILVAIPASAYYRSGDWALTITDPDLIPANIKSGANIFGVAGNSNVINTTEATAPAEAWQIYPGAIAYVNGLKITGAMDVYSDEFNTIQILNPSTTAQYVMEGYHAGSYVPGDPDLIGSNIAKDTNIFGVQGTLERFTSTNTLDMSVAVNGILNM